MLRGMISPTEGCAPGKIFLTGAALLHVGCCRWMLQVVLVGLLTGVSVAMRVTRCAICPEPWLQRRGSAPSAQAWS
jgi:hypothetical protein